MISGILLAAGAGVRFGGRKLLYPLADGTPLGIASLRNLRAAVPRTIAVVRAGDRELLEALSAEGVPVLECADAALGMGHTLAAAVAHESSAQGWVVALGDMPYIAVETIGRIAEELVRGAPIVVPVFGGQRGHPVGFSRAFGAQLMALRGDSGARAILAAHPAQIRQVEVSDPGVVEDIDTPPDVGALAGS